MAERGSWWRDDSPAIDASADEHDYIETTVDELRTVVQRQAKEIVQLRAMIIGLADAVRAKVRLDDTDLQQAVAAASAELAPPLPIGRRVPRASNAVLPATDPYRSMPGGTHSSPGDVEAAKQLLRAAEDHHFSKRFAQAREIYKEIVERFGATKQAAVARQQIENLRGV